METASLSQITIALDAMGGDYAPHSVLAGVQAIMPLYPEVRFLLYGDERRINPALAEFPEVLPICGVIHTDVIVPPEEKPSVALRQGKNSSMRLAIDAVANGQAAAVVSAGNTGALMAMSKIVLRTLEGIDRPAISTTFPTLKGKSVMLDLGANIDCTPENLFQFAFMGNAFAKVVLGIQHPTIGLLNVGSEDMKGNDIVRSAAALLKESGLPMHFVGYIEGHDIAEGTVDVVVTDGFTGNIALKTAEGTAKTCREYLRRAFGTSLLSKIGFLLARPALKRVFKQIDHRLYNGAMFLGLNGIVVKSHGGADGVSYTHAIKVAIELVRQDINSKIKEEVNAVREFTVTESEVDSL